MFMSSPESTSMSRSMLPSWRQDDQSVRTSARELLLNGVLAFPKQVFYTLRTIIWAHVAKRMINSWRLQSCKMYGKLYDDQISRPIMVVASCKSHCLREACNWYVYTCPSLSPILTWFCSLLGQFYRYEPRRGLYNQNYCWTIGSTSIEGFDARNV